VRLGECFINMFVRVLAIDRLDLTEKQRRVVEDIVKQIMGNVEIDEAKWRIHNVLCPGHPRPRPKND